MTEISETQIARLFGANVAWGAIFDMAEKGQRFYPEILAEAIQTFMDYETDSPHLRRTAVEEFCRKLAKLVAVSNVESAHRASLTTSNRT